MEKVLELEASRIEPTEELSEEDAAKAARRQARAKGIRRTVVKDKARGFNDKIDWKLIDDVEVRSCLMYIILDAQVGNEMVGACRCCLAQRDGRCASKL